MCSQCKRSDCQRSCQQEHFVGRSFVAVVFVLPLA